MSCIVSLYSMEEINLVSTNLQSVLVSFFFFSWLLVILCYQSLLSIKYYFNLNLQISFNSCFDNSYCC